MRHDQWNGIFVQMYFVEHFGSGVTFDRLQEMRKIHMFACECNLVTSIRSHAEEDAKDEGESLRVILLSLQLIDDLRVCECPSFAWTAVF